MNPRELIIEIRRERQRILDGWARSYYFGKGTRRHSAVKFQDSGRYVVLRCGMSGYLGKVMPSSAEPNCRHCIGKRAA